MSSKLAAKWYIPDMRVNITFGEWLGDELHKRGWRVQHFADVIDVGRTTVSGWLHNHKPPRQRNCRRIAQALAIDENEVLVRAGYPPKELGYVLPDDGEDQTAVEEGPGNYHTLARRSGDVRSPDRARKLLDQRLADLEEEIAEIRRLLREEE